MLYPNGHPMINQDIVVASARANAFRIQDTFTPSRSMPLIDAAYGGKDSILDAIGRETTGEDGTVHTLIKFRRKLVTGDAEADYCFLPGVSFMVIHAMGMTAPNFSIRPNDATLAGLSTLSTAQFYGPDELKFHGGGIGTSFEGRGVLSPATDFAAAPPPEGGGCKPSDLDGYACMTSPLPTLTLHWSKEEGGAAYKIAAVGPPGVWVAVGWSPNGAMIGSVAAIAASGEATIHNLVAYAVPPIVAATVDPGTTPAGGFAPALTDLGVTSDATRTVLTLAATPSSEGSEMPTGIVVAHGTGAELAYHGAANRVATTVKFAEA